MYVSIVRKFDSSKNLRSVDLVIEDYMVKEVGCIFDGSGTDFESRDMGFTVPDKLKDKIDINKISQSLKVRLDDNTIKVYIS